MDKEIPSEDLMARIAKGDDDAFEILVSRHQTSILNLIYRLVGDMTQAKDLSQEVFIRVWQAAKTVQLPVTISAGLTATSLGLSLAAGGMASYVMGKRMARMKPAEILRQL